jgi:ketosteroid isomerase-like protein
MTSYQDRRRSVMARVRDAAATMDASSELLEGLAVEKTVVALWAAMDAGDFNRVADSFAEDGVWHRQGKQLKGPAMVRAALAERHPGTRTRHMLTNALVHFDGADSAKLSCYMCVFHHQGEPDAPSPAPMDVPITVNLSKVRLRRRADGWKIVELKSADTFRRK